MPKVLGEIELNNMSMMMCLYMPIVFKDRDSVVYLPDQYKWVMPLIDKAMLNSYSDFKNPYIYLTVKSGWVVGEHTMQRPGFHTDGFMTDDINYLWSDNNPTQFIGGCILGVPQDHKESLELFDSILDGWDVKPLEYPNNSLLRLNEKVIHRSRPVMTTGFRNFVKITISDHQYRLIGNTVNPMVKGDWINDIERSVTRNCPLGGVSDGN